MATRLPPLPRRRSVSPRRRLATCSSHSLARCRCQAHSTPRGSSPFISAQSGPFERSQLAIYFQVGVFDGRSSGDTRIYPF
jgi:hypothetical protein